MRGYLSNVRNILSDSCHTILSGRQSPPSPMQQGLALADTLCAQEVRISYMQFIWQHPFTSEAAVPEHSIHQPALLHSTFPLMSDLPLLECSSPVLLSTITSAVPCHISLLSLFYSHSSIQSLLCLPTRQICFIYLIIISFFWIRVQMSMFSFSGVDETY